MGNSNLKAVPTRCAPSTSSVAAQNLLIARTALGWTQQRLADVSGISRATIAQLEAGLGDPRLSTIELLARAMQVSPAFLLFNEGDFHAISELPVEKPRSCAERRSLKALDDASDSNHYRSRLEAAIRGVDIATQAGLTSPAQLVGAAIGSARLTSHGTFVGANLAHLMNYHHQIATGVKPQSDSDEGRFAENI